MTSPLSVIVVTSIWAMAIIMFAITLNEIMDLQEVDKGFLIIYVAGSYWADTHEGRTANTYKAMDAGIEVYFKCHYAIIPHLGHWVDPRMTELGFPERPNSFWYVLDNMILPEVDMLLKISEPGVSRGSDAEEQLALSLGIPVIYSIDDVPDNCPEDGGYAEFYNGEHIGKKP